MDRSVHLRKIRLQHRGGVVVVLVDDILLQHNFGVRTGKQLVAAMGFLHAVEFEPKPAGGSHKWMQSIHFPTWEHW